MLTGLAAVPRSVLQFVVDCALKVSLEFPQPLDFALKAHTLQSGKIQLFLQLHILSLQLMPLLLQPLHINLQVEPRLLLHQLYRWLIQQFLQDASRPLLQTPINLLQTVINVLAAGRLASLLSSTCTLLRLAALWHVHFLFILINITGHYVILCRRASPKASASRTPASTSR